jgi:hypothetical protein
VRYHSAVGTFNVRTDRKPGILWFEIEGFMTVEDATAYVAAHKAAVDSFGDRDYKVFGDIRKMSTLSAEAAALFEQAKKYSSSHPNFRGSAIWVSSSVLVAEQHRRTSTSSGVMGSELISSDENALWDHLAKVHRK